MAIPFLTSKDNPLLKKIRLLSSGSRRAPSGLVIAEGMRVLAEVEACGCALEAVLISDGFGSSKNEEALLNGWLSKKACINRTSESLFRSVSDVKAPQGAIALVRFPERNLETMKPDGPPLILFACGIQDPGNLGTLIRTAAAAAASFVCTGKETVSPKNPKTIRASAGAVFRIPILEGVSVEEFLSYCRRHKIQAYRTDVRRGIPHTRADLNSPCAILLGNEGGGITIKDCSLLPAIRIPMAEKVESLNVAIAGAIVLFEAFRQRTAV